MLLEVNEISKKKWTGHVYPTFSRMTVFKWFAKMSRIFK